jgi:hypothetical protein
MSEEATQTGAKNPDLRKGELEVKPNPRDIAIEAMTARMEAAREQELQDALANDPGLAMQHKAMQEEMEAGHKEAEEQGLLERDYPHDGAASVEPMHPEEKEEKSKLPDNLENDPLAEFIEMQDGQPMFRTKVDGEIRMIPLEDARRELQIGVAAASRMNEVSAARRHLDDRERRLIAGETALEARIRAMQQNPPAPAAAPQVSDDNLLEEAQEIFETAFSGTEEEAARKLAKTLGKIKASVATPAQPTIDANGIARQAANIAMSTIRNDEREKDVQEGYQAFKSNYPDVMNDPMLYRMADDMTDDIANENPMWPISQVMDEAGRRTRAWVTSLTGEQNTDTASDTEEPSTQGSTTQSTQTRQDRKANLVRMPTSAQSAIYEGERDDSGEEQTPLEAFRELRAARGQPI